ncbi:MAG: type II CAAX endopeptidase family protein [Candidatus Zixiibacteriota bacterium]
MWDDNTESGESHLPAPPLTPEGGRRLPSWDGGHAILFYVLSALTALLLGVLLLGPLGFYGSVALTEILGFALAPYIVSRWFDTGWKRWTAPARVRFAFWLWAVVAVLAFAITESNLPVLIDRFYPIPPTQLEFYRRYLAADSPGELALFLLVAAAIPAVCEEITFRGIIQSGLRHSFGSRHAIIWSGFLFALLHLNPWNFVGLWVFGCLLGYLTERSGSIRPAIVVHALNNALALAVFTAQSPDQWERPLEWVPWYVTLPAGLALLVSVYRLHRVPIDPVPPPIDMAS